MHASKRPTFRELSSATPTMVATHAFNGDSHQRWPPKVEEISDDPIIAFSRWR